MGFVVKIGRNTYLEEKHFAKKEKKKHASVTVLTLKRRVCVCLREKFLKFKRRLDILFISGKTRSVSCSSFGVPGGGRMNQWV